VGVYVGASAVVVAFVGFPDRHWFLVWLLGLVFLLGWRNRQPVLRALYDWLPLLVILAAYDLVRSHADSLIARAHLEPMIKFDEFIGFGTAPSVRLQDALFNARHPHWYDYVSLVIYSSHFLAAITLGLCVYFIARGRFVQYAFTFLACSLAGFATYVIYPAVPPWMASRQGALPHLYRAVDVIWDHVGVDFLAKVFSGNPKYSNPVGALPSEHAAYPLLFLLLFWAVASTRWRVVLVAYVAAMAFVLVYFAEHYVLDILAGYVYAVAAFWLVGRILERRSAKRTDAGNAEAPDG
jgi:membrane-associated phospholipid phosphatase